MKITYDKPKYKLGDEFESKDGTGMLSRTGYGTIGIIMLTGVYRGSVWKSGVKAHAPSTPTDEEVMNVFGTGNFEPVNTTKINIEVTEDELKVLWTRVNKGRMESDDEVMIGDVCKFGDIKYQMWDKINDACIELGLKDSYGFKE